MYWNFASKESVLLRITVKYCTKCGTFLDKPIVQQSVDYDDTQKEFENIGRAMTLLIAKLGPKTRKKLLKASKS